MFALKKRTHRTSMLAVAVVTALFGFTLVPTAGDAAFTPDQQACRNKISKAGSKLANKASSAMSKCHHLRDIGKIGAGTNCNNIAQADPKGAVAAAADKLVTAANSNCTGLTPSDLAYTGCPSPCDGTVPAINDFQNVADCIVCVAEDHAVFASFNAQGNPGAPMASSVDQKCHNSLGQGVTKVMKTVVKERTKCQKAAEAAGAMDTSSCISADPKNKINKADTKARSTVQKQCANADLFAMDACSTNLTTLKECVFGEARARGRLTFKAFYELAPGGGVTTTTFVGSTTTTTTSTSTTLPGGPQDPKCPDLGELTLLAGTGATCTDNGDCLAGECDTGLGRCVTVTDLDTGWSGISHDADINDKVVTLGNLNCTGPAPVCGQCTILGVNPDTRTCRCANNNRNICDQPFVVDADDCGAGVICDCYFGGPLPLSAGNTPACVLNRFASDVSGTANVDTGSGSVTAHLRSKVFLGVFLHEPCPVCGGTCTAGLTGSTCAVNLDCDTSPGIGDGTCSNYDPTPNDGLRGGTCYQGKDDGSSCDIDSVNTTFPSPGGGGHSLDCFPTNGKNVSGAGLKIDITQTTGTQSLSSNVPCGAIGVPRLCQCGECSNDPGIPCTSNGDCGAGTCGAELGLAVPNQCDGEGCTDTGDGITGECTTGPDDTSCDAIVRANGEGFISCQGNSDCDVNNIGLPAGLCTLSKRRNCFLPTIVSNGVAHPTAPIGAGVFCIPKTSNGGINSVAGLPGPGRVVNQGRSRTFCASDHGTVYSPGVGGCP
jgi:hypothetical protein